MADRTLYEADWIVFMTAGGHDKLVIHQTVGQVCAAEVFSIGLLGPQVVIEMNYTLSGL